AVVRRVLLEVPDGLRVVPNSPPGSHDAGSLARTSRRLAHVPEGAAEESALPRRREPRVVPEELELAAVAAAALPQLAHRRDGLLLGEVLDDRLVHHDQRPLDERQRPPGAQVEDRVRVADATAEAGGLGEADRRVVREPRVRPGLPRRRVLEAEVVLTPAPSLLADPLLLARADEELELLPRLLRIAVGAVARVQAELVAAGGDPAEQAADARLVERVVAVDRPRRPVGDEVEGASQAARLARVHQRVVGVVEVGGRVAAAAAHERP